MLADSSFLYKHNAIMANSERGVRKKGSLFIWLFDICGLQFGIVREAFLPLGFGSGIWWFALSWCVVTFGFDLWLSLWFVCNSYLVFVNLWFFGLYLVLYLWKRAILVYLGFGFVRVSLHQFVLSQIWFVNVCLFRPLKADCLT